MSEVNLNPNASPSPAAGVVPPVTTPAAAVNASPVVPPVNSQPPANPMQIPANVAPSADIPPDALKVIIDGYKARVDSMRGRVTPANIDKLKSIFTDDSARVLATNKYAAGIVSAFLEIIAQNEPIRGVGLRPANGSGPAGETPQAPEWNVDPVGAWVARQVAGSKA